MQFKSFINIIILLSTLVWTNDSLATPITIESTFDGNSEGWGRSGDSGSSLRYSNGNGGFIYIQDAANGITDWFIAPSKFQGNLSNFLDGFFSFDIRLSILSNPTAGIPFATIRSSIGELQTAIRVSNPIQDLKAGQWSTLSFQLTPDSWLLNGRTPNLTEFASILSSVNQIRILGDWRSGTETVSLDNVKLSGNVHAVPEPSTAGALLLGLIGLSLLYGRRASSNV